MRSRAARAVTIFTYFTYEKNYGQNGRLVVYYYAMESFDGDNTPEIPGEFEDWGDIEETREIQPPDSLIIRDEGGDTYVGGDEPEIPETQRMEELFVHIDDAQKKAFESFITAINSAAQQPRPEEDTDDHSNTMMAAASTEQNVLAYRHTLDAREYNETLRYAGLEYKTTGFVPDLIISDGRQFSEALDHVNAASAIMKQGAETALDKSLRDLATGYIPNMSDEDAYLRFHTQPQLQPHLSDPDHALPYYALKGTLFDNADAIAESMRSLDMSPYAYDDLLAARVANSEGMLGEWAVARHWGLYKPATTRDADRRWTSWRTEADWAPLFEYVDHVIEKAGLDSPFTQHLLSRTVANFNSKRMGILDNPLPNPANVAGVTAIAWDEGQSGEIDIPDEIKLDALGEQMTRNRILQEAEERLRSLIYPDTRNG